MTKKYDALDAEILACIASGRCKFVNIESAVSAAARRTIDASSNRTPERVTDSRLQALRKTGVIKFQFGARGWVMA